MVQDTGASSCAICTHTPAAFFIIRSRQAWSAKKNPAANPGGESQCSSPHSLLEPWGLSVSICVVRDTFGIANDAPFIEQTTSHPLHRLLAILEPLLKENTPLHLDRCSRVKAGYRKSSIVWNGTGPYLPSWATAALQWLSLSFPLVILSETKYATDTTLLFFCPAFWTHRVHPLCVFLLPSPFDIFYLQTVFPEADAAVLWAKIRHLDPSPWWMLSVTHQMLFCRLLSCVAARHAGARQRWNSIKGGQAATSTWVC